MFKSGSIFSRLKNVSGELSIIVVGKSLSLLFNILGLKWVTYLVDPSIFGQFTLILSYIFIVELLFGVLAQGIGRYYFLSKERNEYNTLKGVFLYYLKFIGIFALFLSLWIGVYIGSILMSFMVFIFTMVSGISNIISLIQNSERQRIIVSMHEMFDKIFKFGLAGIFILYFSATVISLMVGYVVAVLLIAISQFYFYNKKIRIIYVEEDKIVNDEKVKKYKKDILHYSIPFLVWTIFYWVQINSDKWLIDAFFSKREVGQYQVINQYGFQLINIAVGMLSLFMIPILFKKATSIDEKVNIINSINLNNRVSGIIFGLFMVFIPFTFLIHKALFNLLVSEEFTTYSYLFPYIVFAGGCFAVAQLLSNNYLISFRTKSLIAPKISVALFGILVNLISIKYFGIIGLVLGIMITNLFYLLWMFFGSMFLKRRINESILDIT